MLEESKEELADLLKTYMGDGLLCSKCYASTRKPLLLTCMHSFCDRCQKACTPAVQNNKAEGIDLRKCPICSSSKTSRVPECFDFVGFENGNLDISSHDSHCSAVTSPAQDNHTRTHNAVCQTTTTPTSSIIDAGLQKPIITGVTILRTLDESAKVKVSWESCPGAFLYRTKFSNNEGNDNFLKEITFQQLRYPANTSVVIDGLRANCRYCISLQAVYEPGTSDFGQKHYITTSRRVNRTACFLSTHSKAIRVFVDSQTQTCAANCYTWNEETRKEYSFFERGNLQLLKGVTGNRWFSNNDCEYWEVVVTLYIKQRPRAKVDIFCLGIVQEDQRDEYSPLSSNIYSAGCALYKVAYKPSLALTWWNGGKWRPTAADKELVNLHEAIYKKRIIRLGFMLDMMSHTLCVVDVIKNELLNVIDKIKPTKCLPAFELFDDKTADIEVNYVTGPDIERLPTILSGDDNS